MRRILRGRLARSDAGHAGRDGCGTGCRGHRPERRRPGSRRFAAFAALARPIAALALCAIASLAHAATATYEVLLDLDLSTATGCVVATPKGDVGGIDQMLVTTVNTTETGAVVADVSRRVCSGGALGAPIAVDPGGWPVGFANGTKGAAVVETHVPWAALGGATRARLAVVATGGGGTDAIVGAPGMLPSIVLAVPAGPAASAIPLLSPLGLALLAALLGACGWRATKGRRIVGVVAAGLMVSSLAGLAWAASMLLDGHVGDWAGVSPSATDAKGNAPLDADLVAIFAQSDGTRVYFRIDADLIPDNPLNLPPVATLDAPAAVQAVVGADGGVVEARSGGKRFRLSIPAEALERDTTIVMTPIVSMTGLPFGGPVLAAVRLEPDGLVFRRRASLSISGMPTAPPDPWGAAQSIVGFSSSAGGTLLETMVPVIVGDTATLDVAHFSDTGTADTRARDLEARLRPILQSIGPNPSPQVALRLVAEVATWLTGSVYGFDPCTVTTLCRDIFDLGAGALAAELEEALKRMEAHLAQGEPYLAFDDLRIAVGLIQKLAEISEVAARAGARGFDFEFDITGLAAGFESIIDLAKQQALERPRRGLLLLILDVGAEGDLAGLDGIFAKSVAALVEILEDILADARVLCRTDPPAGEALLDLILADQAGMDLLTSLSLHAPNLRPSYLEERTACPIQVEPRPARVAMFEALQLGGTAVGYSPATVTWAIDGFAGNASIDATGRFTAANVSGTYTVAATSVADPGRVRRVPVEVVPIDVAVSPESVTLAVGQSQPFTAVVTGPTNTAVVWTATGGTIDPATGVFSASAPGTYTVRATSVLDSGFFDEATVTVSGVSGQLTLLGRESRVRASAEGCAGQQSQGCVIQMNTEDISSLPNDFGEFDQDLGEKSVTQAGTGIYAGNSTSAAASAQQFTALVPGASSLFVNALVLNASGASTVVQGTIVSAAGAYSALSSLLVRFRIVGSALPYQIHGSLIGDSPQGNATFSLYRTDPPYTVVERFESNPSFGTSGTLVPGFYELSISVSCSFSEYGSTRASDCGMAFSGHLAVGQ